MLTICREIGTSIQGSVMELNQIFELIFPLLMASDNISVSFLPPVDLLMQDVRPVCAWSDIESWFWLMRSNTNTSGRCSHLDGLSVSRRQIGIDTISSTCKDTERGTPLHLYFLSVTSLRFLRFSLMQNTKSFLKKQGFFIQSIVRLGNKSSEL